MPVWDLGPPGRGDEKADQHAHQDALAGTPERQDATSTFRLTRDVEYRWRWTARVSRGPAVTGPCKCFVHKGIPNL